jgi:hypothetical protein
MIKFSFFLIILLGVVSIVLPKIALSPLQVHGDFFYQSQTCVWGGSGGMDSGLDDVWKAKNGDISLWCVGAWPWAAGEAEKIQKVFDGTPVFLSKCENFSFEGAFSRHDRQDIWMVGESDDGELFACTRREQGWFGFPLSYVQKKKWRSVFSEIIDDRPLHGFFNEYSPREIEHKKMINIFHRT